MSGGASMTVEIPASAMAGIRQSAEPGPYVEAIRLAAETLMLVGERAAKERTPQVTGNARRTTVSNRSGSNAMTVVREVRGRYPYLGWLDTGRDERGRVMRTKPGGYQIRSAAMTAAHQAGPKVMEDAFREIANKWSNT